MQSKFKWRSISEFEFQEHNGISELEDKPIQRNRHLARSNLTKWKQVIEVLSSKAICNLKVKVSTFLGWSCCIFTRLRTQQNSSTSNKSNLNRTNRRKRSSPRIDNQVSDWGISESAAFAPARPSSDEELIIPSPPQINLQSLSVHSQNIHFSSWKVN